MNKQKKYLVSKLNQLLTRPNIKECEVLCILVNTRKILEYQKNNRDELILPLLKFYCDWVLHIKIDKSSGAKKIVKKLDNAVNDYFNNRENDDSLPIQITKIISFKKFKKELSDFLLKFNLPNKIIKDNKIWKNFINLYVDIIAECPLMTNEKINHVKQFLITKKHNKNCPKWQIELVEDANGYAPKFIGSL